MTEEEKMYELQAMDDNLLDNFVYAFPDIPSFLINNVNELKYNGFETEFSQIRLLYYKFKKGCDFITEGSNQDYIPSSLRYKKAAMIIKKEARFCFSNPPTFNVNPDNVENKDTEENAIIQNFLEKVLEKNNYRDSVLKALKDCFIGKRIAILLNFNETDGITITFLTSLEFIYETEGNKIDRLTKFIAFYKINSSNELKDQRWFRKTYTKEKDGIYLIEEIFSGTGELIKKVTPKTKIKFDFIPATIVLNDGLTGDIRGESELQDLIDYEKYYSKLANADMDAERKSMNPIRWTIDASNDSTKMLSTSPGSYWDLQTDQDKPNENTSARVGTLEAQMNYSTPLKTTLDRIENEMYAEVDVPNINSEQLAGVITSGKTLKALYWGLVVRCNEKMLAWENSLRFMATTIIEGAKLFPDSIKQYTDVKKIPDIDYKIVVENNYPLPEDIQEEKTLDMAEVETKVMSRKAYLKKWRNLSDEKANEELQQIKLEQDLLDNAVISYNLNDSFTDENISKGDEFTNLNNTKPNQGVQQKTVESKTEVKEQKVKEG